MSIFKLPDLGEGLPDAEISEWHVKIGDEVKVDQQLASMETAKAVVEVPSPQAGVIKKLYGEAGDIIKTGAPLVEFEGEGAAAATTETIAEDAGTVVGQIESRDEVLQEQAIVGSSKSATNKTRVKATPAVRALARKLGVDLAAVTASGANGVITSKDVEAASGSSASSSDNIDEGYTPLRGVRRSMAQSMAIAHQKIVPVTIYDDADINVWSDDADISVRIIQAITYACEKEPALNAWFDDKNNAVKRHNNVALGLAVDTEDGLFVPVIKDANNKDANQLRSDINRLKTAVKQRELPPEDLTGGTITLSNFGMFAGRYATPVVVPPMVAIIGVGKMQVDAVAVDNKIEAHRVIPLSLTFDHRAVTGGEATRFLGAVIEALTKG